MDFESNKFIDELTFGKRFSFFSLDKAQELFKFELSNIPFSYRLLLENLIRKSKRLPLLKTNSISYKVKRESIINNLANEFNKHLNISAVLN